MSPSYPRVLAAAAALCLLGTVPTTAQAMIMPPSGTALTAAGESGHSTVNLPGQPGFVSTGPMATSQGWVGYASTNGQFHDVSSQWTQPKATCDADNGWTVFWVGLDGWGSHTVEQTGTSVRCQNGQPEYTGWWETFPDNPITNYPDPVDAGDQFTASVTFTGNDNYELNLTDVTKNWTEKQTVRGADGASNHSAEVVAEVPGGGGGRHFPTAGFEPTTFTASMVNGQPLGTANPMEVDLVANGQTVATPSALTDGTTFTITRQ